MSRRSLISVKSQGLTCKGGWGGGGGVVWKEKKNKREGLRSRIQKKKEEEKNVGQLSLGPSPHEANHHTNPPAVAAPT